MSTATILDVARLANVSSGTVSRVLRGHPSVSPDNSERVLRAVEHLNYSPRHRKASMSDVNPLERKNLLLLLLGMDENLASLPIISSVIHGVQRAVSAARASLTTCDVPGADHLPEELLRRRFDGLIIKGALQGNLTRVANPELLGWLRAIPTVWLLGRPTDWGDVVQPNDMLVGRMAAEYLTSRGHRRLAFVNAKSSHVTLSRRMASLEFYAKPSGATVTGYLGEPDPYHLPSPAINRVELVQDLVDKLLAERDRPTAIFTPCDSMGAMVARALAARGLQAGREISLMSCNNEQPLLMGIHPNLTTLDVHSDEIGRRAVDQLAWRLSHRDLPSCEVGIDPTLVEGGSVAVLKN